MSQSEQNETFAARVTAFYRCNNKSNDLTQEQTDQVNEMLAAEPVRDFQWGHWNAAQIVANGLVPPKQFEILDEDYDGSCDNDFDYSTIIPIPRAPLQLVSQVDDMWATSLGEASRSATYYHLREQMSQCVGAAGYTLDDRYPQAMLILVDDSVSDAEMRRVATVGAACNDNLGIAQTLANIAAKFQAQWISEHQDDADAVRARAQETLSRAREILQDAGFE